MRQVDAGEIEHIETLSRAIAMVLTRLASQRTVPENHPADVFPPAAPFDEPLIDVATAAKHLGIGRTAMYELVRTRAIPSIRLGRSVRIRRATLLKWIQERETDKS